MKTYNEVKLEKIFEKIDKKFKDPKNEYINPQSKYTFYSVEIDRGYAALYSAIEPEITIEKIRKYLKDFDRYTINITYSCHLYHVTIVVYNPSYNETVFIYYPAATVVKEIGNGFIYKSDFIIAPQYDYISNFDLIKSNSYPSRKKETLKFYCKGFSYEKVNRIYKKYTGKGLSKATYLKYNLG